MSVSACGSQGHIAITSLNASKFGVIIDGAYRNYLDAMYYIDVQADNVTIKGFTFLTSNGEFGIGIHAENCKNLVIADARSWTLTVMSSCPLHL